jgi:phosphatidate phosphatase APP1
VTGVGRVLSPSPAAPFAVVSDVDDTVIQTGLAEGLTALRRTLFRDAHSRRAIPGMASLYRGLAKAAGSAPPSGGISPVPFFYVSTGAWSFYEMLTQFLQLRGFPRGPLFLTDWGPTDRYLTRSGAEHKRTAIRRLLAAYPSVPFLFVGDTGQADPEIYEQLAHEQPDRVVAIVLVPAGHDEERAEDLAARAERLQADGVPFHVVGDAREATLVAVGLGLCAPEVVEDVEIELAART